MIAMPTAALGAPAVGQALEFMSKPEQIASALADGRIRAIQIPNPHWREDGCQACHRMPARSGRPNLRDPDADRVCAMCHSGVFDHSYIHPTGIKPGAAMKARMPQSFRHLLSKDGTLACRTCHDIKAQCLSDRAPEKRTNPQFFRDGPYREPVDLCYRCHDDEGYARLNAHDQVSDEGKLKEHTCTICHTENKRGAFHNKDNLVWMCRSCHRWRVHPSSGFSFSRKGIPNHLVVPSEAVLRKMKQSEQEYGITLPLDPNTGRIYCATCHNPHERGVIKRLRAARGASKEKRLRKRETCLNCHDK
jgi:predicted CXXCH cytochrome family protein